MSVSIIGMGGYFSFECSKLNVFIGFSSKIKDLQVYVQFT
jgi:hypothetical protein